MGTERHDFVEHDIQGILDKTGEDIVVTYGFWKDKNFTASSIDVNEVSDVREGVFIRYKQSPEWDGTFQSIVGDCFLYILSDVFKSDFIKRMWREDKRNENF